MAKLLMVVKILPTGTEVNLDDMVDSVRQNLKDGIELKQYEKEPLAFGLEFIKAQFVLAGVWSFKHESNVSWHEIGDFAGTK